MTTSSTLDLRLPQYPKTGMPELDLALAPVFNALRLLQQSAQNTSDVVVTTNGASTELQLAVHNLSVTVDSILEQLAATPTATIYSSLTNPSNAYGADGDLWIVANKTAWFKVAGVWGIVLVSSTVLYDYVAKIADLGTAAYIDIGQCLPYSKVTLTVSSPVTSKLFVVSDGNATVNANILAYVQKKANGIPDELECEPITVHASCTTNGSINIILSCPWFFSGTYTINYSIGL